jgi:hypothetical protein
VDSIICRQHHLRCHDDRSTVISLGC